MGRHWKQLMDKEYLFAHDLSDKDGKDRDVTVEIVEVIGGELKGESGKTDKKPVAILKGTKKKLALNATNCSTIEQLYGTADYTKWAGKRITLFPTTTTFGRKTVPCIRIRPNIPAAPRAGSKQDEPIDPPAPTGELAADGGAP